ncbi:MAG: hypothetical protein DI626_06990, partial [Micavibrio aeruginosavorus]
LIASCPITLRRIIGVLTVLSLPRPATLLKAVFHYLRRDLAASREACSQDVLNILARLGYFSRSSGLNIREIDSRILPVIFVHDNVPLIILSKEDQKLKIFRNGEESYIDVERLHHTSGKAITFERFDETRPATSKFVRSATGNSWFRSLLGRFHGTFAQILSAGLVINLISLATPLMIMLVYNRVISTGTVETLPMIMAGMALAIVFEIFLRNTRSRGLSWIAARLDNSVGNVIFAHFLNLPPSLIERASVPAQIARIKTFESIRDFFCGSVFLSLIEMPFIVFAALAIYFIAGSLVLVPFVMSLLYAILFIAIYKKVKTSIRIAARSSSTKQQFAINSFEKIRGIRAYGLTETWMNKYRDLSGKEMMAHFHLGFLGMAGETLANALTILSAAVTIAFGAHMVWTGQIGTGALVATMILVWRVTTPFYNFCTIIPRLEQIRQSIIQVNTLMDMETEDQKAKFASVLAAIKGRITFSNISVKYQEDADSILSGMSMDIQAGDIVSITGENGAGKSSLLKIVKGLYKPATGFIQIDGFDVRQLDGPSLRRQIAYVPQHADYFEGSILENLRLCNPMASEDDVREALRLAVCLDAVEAMPDKLDTVINRYTTFGLPDNLALRLSLARLYLHTAPILLIDEIPNSVLSGNAGKNLRDYLARIKGKRTCLIVTYREDFMTMSDTVLYLRRGQAPLYDTPQKLMKLITEAA